MPLNNTQIKNAKPKEKAYKLSDEGGLYLLVKPNGGKYWRMDYRFALKRKTLAIGVYPTLSLKEAREAREAAKKLLANGTDPGDVKRAQKAAIHEQAENSFQLVALEWHTTNKPKWSESHAFRAVQLLERDVFPFLGKLPIDTITPPMLLQCLRKIESRGALYTAHRAKQLAGQIFRYAVATGRAERDPSADLKGALPSPTETHFAAVVEPQEVGKLLLVMDGYQGTPTVRAALSLAPLVFVRPGELRKAKWSEVNFDTAEWRIPGERMKMKQPHIVPLAKQAINILRDIHPITQRSEYIFPSARSGKRPMSENAVLGAMRRLGIEKEVMSGHGFRAMARTILDEILGFRPDYIEHQLAHAVRDVNGRAYNRTSHLPQRKEMMQKWADYLDMLRLQAKNGNVVAIHRKTS